MSFSQTPSSNRRAALGVVTSLSSPGTPLATAGIDLFLPSSGIARELFPSTSSDPSSTRSPTVRARDGEGGGSHALSSGVGLGLPVELVGASPAEGSGRARVEKDRFVWLPCSQVENGSGGLADLGEEEVLRKKGLRLITEAEKLRAARKQAQGDEPLPASTSMSITPPPSPSSSSTQMEEEEEPATDENSRPLLQPTPLTFGRNTSRVPPFRLPGDADIPSSHASRSGSRSPSRRLQPAFEPDEPQPPPSPTAQRSVQRVTFAPHPRETSRSTPNSHPFMPSVLDGNFEHEVERLLGRARAGSPVSRSRHTSGGGTTPLMRQFGDVRISSPTPSPSTSSALRVKGLQREKTNGGPLSVRRTKGLADNLSDGEAGIFGVGRTEETIPVDDEIGREAKRRRKNVGRLFDS
ncbi:hypothetical protein BT69DRAFT_1332484 [Atractiella rhizophila]|nr:hypothetical protein BT69DRAFT_1332484 [Atractiella rhizophila]